MRKKQHFGLIFLFSVIFVVLGLATAVLVQTATSPYININTGSGTTKMRKVQLYINGPDWAKFMKISNQADLADAEWEEYKTSKLWYLSYGSGIKTVYVQFKSSTGKISELYRKDVRLNISSSMSVDFTINDGVTTTVSRYVTLNLSYNDAVEGYIVSNDINSIPNLEFKKMSKNVAWILTPGAGQKTVYIQFLDANGLKKTVNQTITYNQPSVYLSEGTIVKGQGSSLYYYGYDGRLHPFLNSAVYHSWYRDFDSIRYVSDAKLSQFQVGQQVCVRPGTWLLKFKGFPTVYAVEPGCQLRPILSEAEAYLIYGSGWTKRILELDLVSAGGYVTLSYDVADDDLEIVDQDRDGVDSVVEKDYGTSDRKADSDGDGLSDLEEINYWYTDPTLKDTDNDKYGDLTEILNGFPPAGYGNLNTLLNDTYDYPRGSVVKNFSNGKLYYRHSNGNYYLLGKDSSATKFISNNLDSKFIINSPFNINFIATNKGTLSVQQLEIYYPTQTVAGDVVQL